MELILGLGSNLGDRIGYFRKAIDKISGSYTIKKIAYIYESEAQLPEGSSGDWNIKFLNTALLCESSDDVQDVLRQIKSIEKELGRKDTKQRWAPREIDIDILCYGNTVIAEKDLSVPHGHLLERPFAIWPLADVCPGWNYPAGGNKGKIAFELAQIFGVKYPDDVKSPGNPYNTVRTDIELK